MATLTDEQYQQFLDIYDETYGGLTWDQSEGNYIVTGASGYEHEYEDTGDTYRVWKDEGGQIIVNGDILVEDMSHYLTEAGIDGDLYHECQQRLAAENR